MSITLHGANLSPFVRKALVVFAEKGIAFEHADAVPFPKTEELLAKSPLGKIPFLEVDGTFLPDSSIICAWAEKTQPDPALYPKNPIDFARTLWLEEYADTKVADVGTTSFFQRFIRPNIFQQEPDEERVKQVMAEDLPPVLDYLTRELGDDDYLVGNRFTLADIAVCSPFVNMRLGREDVDAGRWPKFGAYLERILARPSYKTALAGLPDSL